MPDQTNIAQQHGKFLDNAIFVISSGGLLFIANKIFEITESGDWPFGVVLLSVSLLFLLSIITLYLSFNDSIKEHAGKSRSWKDTLFAVFIFLAFLILWIYGIVHVVSLAIQNYS